jgi:hypothetical protein
MSWMHTCIPWVELDEILQADNIISLQTGKAHSRPSYLFQPTQSATTTRANFTSQYDSVKRKELISYHAFNCHPPLSPTPPPHPSEHDEKKQHIIFARHTAGILITQPRNATYPLSRKQARKHHSIHFLPFQTPTSVHRISTPLSSKLVARS